jgi:hypothetical protein
MDVKESPVEAIVRSPNYPKDAKILALILKSMGIEDFEPRVIVQLLDFMHRTAHAPRIPSHLLEAIGDK